MGRISGKNVISKILNSGTFTQKIYFLLYLKRINNIQADYLKCKSIWDKDETLVHGDVSPEAMKKISEYIHDIIMPSKEDIILDVGCGDGVIDQFLYGESQKYMGFDFSESKIRIAKKNNPKIDYWNQSFLDEIKTPTCIKPNKVFSFSVMQYCKKEDLYTFISNQINCLEKDGNGLVYMMDVPDVDKAYNYYTILFPKLTKSYIERHRKDFVSIFKDGSYWIDMEYVKSILSQFECIRDVEMIEGMSDYRTTLIIRC